MKNALFALACLVLAGASASNAGAATLVGSKVRGSLSSEGLGAVILEQFATDPVAVGDGAELSGQFKVYLSTGYSTWDVDVDFDATGFSVLFDSDNKRSTRSNVSLATINFWSYDDLGKITETHSVCKLSNCPADPTDFAEIYRNNYVAGKDATGQTRHNYTVNFTLLAAETKFRFDILGAEVPPTPAVPEPATWATMLVGFGMVGGAVRYRRRKVTASIA